MTKISLYMINTDGVFSKYVQFVGCKDAADCTRKMIASEHHPLDLLSLESKWSPSVSVSASESYLWARGSVTFGLSVTWVPDAWLC